MIDYQQLIQQAIDAGFTRAAPLCVDDLNFLHEVRDMCAADKCHAYNHSWSCPPACGTIEECEARVRCFHKGILVQTVGQLEDDFDVDTMMETSRLHGETFSKMKKELEGRFGNILALGAGGCTKCETCTYPDAPCRFPDTMVSSMEAYGLMVSDVCASCGLPYITGQKTITYIGCFLVE